jgi:predicted O-linked N-acetylglucosamine transferase (SPINDLY family)
MGRGEYHALCDCVDILLDPFYYGSGITFFEASYVGTPIVTLEGENLRTRVVANGYREMKLDDPPITANTDEYVELVTHLCNDVDRRARLKSSILANNFRVFDRIDYVRGFEEFCLSLYPSF